MVKPLENQLEFQFGNEYISKNQHNNKRINFIGSMLIGGALTIIAATLAVSGYYFYNPTVNKSTKVNSEIITENKPKELTREDFIPTLNEFNAFKEGDGLIEGIFRISPSADYIKKIQLIKNNTKLAFSKLTEEEKRSYDKFFNRTMDEIPDSSNLEVLVQDIDWEKVIEIDYASYNPKINFTDPDDFDKLIIFLHESSYERRKEEKVEIYKNLDFSETWNQLYAGIKVGSKKIPFKFGDTIYFVKYRSLISFANYLSEDMSEEDAWKRILDFAGNGEYSVAFSFDSFRNLDYNIKSKDPQHIALCHYWNGLEKRFENKDTILSLGGKVPDLDSFLNMKNELIRLRKVKTLKKQIRDDIVNSAEPLVNYIKAMNALLELGETIDNRNRERLKSQGIDPDEYFRKLKEEKRKKQLEEEEYNRKHSAPMALPPKSDPTN
jgi:hypothetical protein